MVAFRLFASQARRFFNPVRIAAISVTTAALAALSHPVGLQITGLDFQKPRMTLDQSPTGSTLKIHAAMPIIHVTSDRHIHGLSGAAQPLRVIHLQDDGRADRLR